MRALLTSCLIDPACARRVHIPHTSHTRLNDAFQRRAGRDLDRLAIFGVLAHAQ